VRRTGSLMGRGASQSPLRRLAHAAHISRHFTAFGRPAPWGGRHRGRVRVSCGCAALARLLPRPNAEVEQRVNRFVPCIACRRPDAQARATPQVATRCRRRESEATSWGTSAERRSSSTHEPKVDASRRFRSGLGTDLATFSETRFDRTAYASPWRSARLPARPSVQEVASARLAAHFERGDDSR
jgi:hypothetical protein